METNERGNKRKRDIFQKRERLMETNERGKKSDGDIGRKKKNKKRPA